VAWTHGTSGIVPACAPSIDGADGIRTASAPDVVAWLGDRFAGVSPPSTCREGDPSPARSDRSVTAHVPTAFLAANVSSAAFGAPIATIAA
jgi:hypothetical protein